MLKKDCFQLVVRTWTFKIVSILKWFIFIETSTILKGRVDILGSDVYIGTEVQPRNTSSCTISNNSFNLREEEMPASKVRVARNRGKGHHT